MGFLGAILAGFFFNREIFSFLSFGLWLRLVISALFLFFLSWFLILFFVFYMPENFGLMTWLIGGGLLLLMLTFHFGLGFLFLRWFHTLQPATESLKKLVAEVSEKMCVPVRATWILSTYVTNAAAFPQTRELIFTDRLLSILSDQEIKAICAHELGHINEPRLVIIVRGLVSFAFFPLIFLRPLSSLGDDGAGAIWLLIIICFGLLFTGIRVGRRMEKRADKIAVENFAGGAIYARALSRLYESNQTPAVMPRRSGKVHPDLYDRMVAAGVTPDFPKPLSPNRQSWTSYLMFAGLFVLPFIAVQLKVLFTLLDAVTFKNNIGQ